ncbi:hypothetical protein AVEN_117137-1 [Araneus ventricosus]|uniref:Uncharacterized protein n=1 Tax=Araneus ventricosus TaxID=182803 RepID=A0A4Y2AWC0_ARAVE|nr:hypothetical protein AVEN_117137-1 [Araneus ventricosus]
MTRTTPELALPSSKLSHHTSGRTFDPLRTIKRASDLHTQWIFSVTSNLEPSGPEAEALPLGQCGQKSALELMSKETNIFLS